MKTKLTIFFAFLSCLIFAQQANDTVVFNYLGHYYFTPESQLHSSYTPLIDRLGRNYVYVASKEAGLVTFDISTPSNPTPANIEPVSSFATLKPVCRLAQ